MNVAARTYVAAAPGRNVTSDKKLVTTSVVTLRVPHKTDVKWAFS